MSTCCESNAQGVLWRTARYKYHTLLTFLGHFMLLLKANDDIVIKHSLENDNVDVSFVNKQYMNILKHTYINCKYVYV